MIYLIRNILDPYFIYNIIRDMLNSGFVILIASAVIYPIVFLFVGLWIAKPFKKSSKAATSKAVSTTEDPERKFAITKETYSETEE